MGNIMYHYCNVDAFKAIIQNKTLWLSSVYNLNDYKEIHWIKEKVLKRIQELTTKNKISVNYTVLKDNSEEVLYLLLDLISLAKIDGEFHITEKLFIKEIAKVLNFNPDELNSLIES